MEAAGVAAHDHSAHSAHGSHGAACDGTMLPPGGGTWIGKEKRGPKGTASGQAWFPVSRVVWLSVRRSAAREAAKQSALRGCREPPVTCSWAACMRAHSPGATGRSGGLRAGHRALLGAAWVPDPLAAVPPAASGDAAVHSPATPLPAFPCPQVTSTRVGRGEAWPAGLEGRAACFASPLQRRCRQKMKGLCWCQSRVCSSWCSLAARLDCTHQAQTAGGGR